MRTSHRHFITAISLTALLLPSIGCQDQTTAELEKYRGMAKMHERNKGIVRELFATIDIRNFNRLEGLLSDDFTLKAPGLAQPWKKAELFQAIKSHYASFPDWTHVAEDLVAEGDYVAVKGNAYGTQKASFEGIAATGRKVTDASMSLITIVNGKVKDWWVLEDNLGFMQQLGMELRPTRGTK